MASDRSAGKSPKPAVHIHCSRCEGTGRVPLVPSLDETLRALARGPRTPSELSDALDVPGTAMNNRLEKLRALGLVTRWHAVSRGYVYAAKEHR
jgi:hypothetical protein